MSMCRREKLSAFLIVVLGGVMLVGYQALAATTIGNNVSVGGTLTVTGATTLTGQVTMSGGFIAPASSTVGADLTVSGDLLASSTLQASGLTRLYGTLTVDGASTLTGAVTASDSVSSTIVTSSRHIGIGVIDSSNANWAGGSLNVGNRLSVDGAAYVSSTLEVTGNSRFYGTLTVDGIATVAGVSTTAGIYPTTNNTRDLGDFGAAFRNVYVSSSLTIGGDGATVSSTAIRAHISLITPAIDLPAAASSTDCTTSSVVMVGAALGDTTIIAPTVWDNAFQAGNLTVLATTTDSGVIVYCTGGNGGDNDPADMQYRIDIWKH